MILTRLNIGLLLLPLAWRKYFLRGRDALSTELI